MFPFNKPSNNRDWSLDQKIPAHADIRGDKVTIYNVRNFEYRSTDDYDPRYYDQTYDLSKIQSLDYVFVPFNEEPRAAHTFLSFGFDEGEYVSISIEIRKKAGEKYNAWRGLFQAYELMYVVADEKDVIKLRTNFRKDKVYLYPIKINREDIRKIFLSMINEINTLYTTPKFYNTFSSACTNNIVKHVNELYPRTLPFSWKIILTGRADEYALDLGLIDTKLPLEKARQKYQINKLAEKYAESEDFSLKIRSNR